MAWASNLTLYTSNSAEGHSCKTKPIFAPGRPMDLEYATLCRPHPACTHLRGVHDRSCAPGDQEGAARGVPHGAFGVPPSGGKNWSDPRKRGTPNGGGRPRKYGHAPVRRNRLDNGLLIGVPRNSRIPR